jgi:hypothetical protein
MAHLWEDSMPDVLVRAAQQVAMTTARALAEQMAGRLEGRAHTDGAELLREDRDR